MLNTQFPLSTEKKYKIDLYQYILPADLQNVITSLNSKSFPSREFRTQEIYGEEIWAKINSLGLEKFKWPESTVLDIACGGGFLSYHLLKRVSPKKLILNDISESAIKESKKLIGDTYPNANVEYSLEDILTSGVADNSLDMIIGNSFIHHFYDLPKAFKEFNRVLKPGGVFISLHEPTPAAVAYESANPIYILMWLIRSRKYINDIRKIKKEFPLENNTGGDVWIFEKDSLPRLLKRSGFQDVTISSWHLFRALLVGLFRVHLTENKPKPNKFDTFVIKTSFIIDRFLTKILPEQFFSSVSVCAHKK